MTLLVGTFFAGWQASEFRRITVATASSLKGTLTLDGKPLSTTVIFYHVDGNQFLGAKSGQDGRYAITIPVGQYRVTIEGEGIHPKYSSEKATELAVAIRGGKNIVDFDLKSR
jgi:hypothetical protein